MAGTPGFLLLCTAGALLALSTVGWARPAGVAGGPVSGQGRSLGDGRIAMQSGVGPGRPGPMAFRGGLRHRGPHVFGPAFYGPGYYDPGFGGGAASIWFDSGEDRRDNEPKPGIPVVVGIQRAPEASPVIYRIEGGKGRASARVIRIDDKGSQTLSGARIVRVGGR